MELLINISEDDFNSVQKFLRNDGGVNYMNIFRTVAKGTPLPRKHGNLKDVDSFDYTCLRVYEGGDCMGICSECRERAVQKLEIDSAPTIIPARNCTTCVYQDEDNGENCYECLKGMEDNYKAIYGKDGD